MYHEFIFLLRKCIGEAIGIETFDEQFSRLSCGEMPLVSLSLRPSISQFFQHCPNQSCREFRYFHRFCFKCGHLYNSVDTYKLADSLKRIYRHGQKKNQKLTQQSHNSSINIGDAIVNSIESDNGYTNAKEDDEYVFDCDPFEWSEIISKDLMRLLTNTPTEMAILRGTYLYFISLVLLFTASLIQLYASRAAVLTDSSRQKREPADEKRRGYPRHLHLGR